MQIGPRIRVGGTLGHIGQELKTVAGQGARFVAPIVSVANPLLGAGIAAAGGALRGKSIADIVKEAAITGGSGYALGKVGGLFGGGEDAASTAGSVAPGGISSAAPSTMNFDGEELASAAPSAAASAAPSASPSASPGLFSHLGDAARSAGSYIKHNPKDVAIGAGYAANAVMQNSANNTANSLARDRLAFEQKQYDDQQARLDPVRALLAKYLAGRFGAGTSV